MPFNNRKGIHDTYECCLQEKNGSNDVPSKNSKRNADSNHLKNLKGVYVKYTNFYVNFDCKYILQTHIYLQIYVFFNVPHSKTVCRDLPLDMSLLFVWARSACVSDQNAFRMQIPANRIACMESMHAYCAMMCPSLLQNFGADRITNFSIFNFSFSLELIFSQQNWKERFSTILIATTCKYNRNRMYLPRYFRYLEIFAIEMHLNRKYTPIEFKFAQHGHIEWHIEKHVYLHSRFTPIFTNNSLKWFACNALTSIHFELNHWRVLTK